MLYSLGSKNIIIIINMIPSSLFDYFALSDS
jgi:hypothetical protein